MKFFIERSNDDVPPNYLNGLQRQEQPRQPGGFNGFSCWVVERDSLETLIREIDKRFHHPVVVTTTDLPEGEPQFTVEVYDGYRE